ncbi:MAG: ABC transporter permease, partial [Myxococcaceae bacterium]
MKELFKLAVRNLARNRRRTLITLAALVLGVGAMVAVRGFINGMQRSFIDNLVEGQLGAVQVHREGYRDNVLASPLTLDMEDTQALRQKILSVPGVKAVTPRIWFGAMISTPDKPVPEGREPTGAELGRTSFFMATAIEPSTDALVLPKRAGWIDRGLTIPGPDSDALLLGSEFADGLGTPLVPPGSPRPPEAEWPALLSPDRDGSLNGANVVVGGTLKSAAPGDRKFGYVALGTAQKVLRMEGRVTEYAIAIDSLDDAEEVRDGVALALGKGYEVHTWKQLVPFITQLFGTQDFVFGIASAIFLLVVLLGIVNAMLMSVLERVREIGTMLAVGMRRRQVVTMFILEGLVLGLLGGLVGAALGAAGVAFMHHVGVPLPAPGSSAPLSIYPFVTAGYLARAVGMASAGSALAALWPARRA